MSKPVNREFEIRGVNHLALVCKDMARTVDFYRDVLGMPLTKTIDLPGGMGQHFFFDIGNGDSLAFFWFPDAPEPRCPASRAPAKLPGQGGIASAHGSMNHLAFNVAPEKFDEYVTSCRSRRASSCVAVLNHDNSPSQISADRHRRRVRPLGLLLRSGRRAARVRRLDPKVLAPGRRPPRGRPRRWLSHEELRAQS